MTTATLIFGPLDGARSALYRWAAPLLGPLYGDRARRVTWLGVFSVAVAFVVSSTVPLWSLALSPLILGVPHLLADVRYLVIKPRLHRHFALVGLCTVPLLATSFGAGPVVGVAASVPAVFFASGAAWRKTAVLSSIAVLLGLAWTFDVGFQLIFLHLHNVVALALWWQWRARSWSSTWVLLLSAVGVALLLGGAADPIISALGMWDAPATGTSFERFIETTTPLESPQLAAHLVLVFAFLQSVHYAVWLRLIPDDARERRAPRPFSASWQALRADFGLVPLLLVAGLALGVAGWGLVSLPDARLGYLRLAAFHGYLELAAAAWLLAGGARR